MSDNCDIPIKAKRGTSKSLSFSLIIDDVQVTDLTDWTCKIQLRLNDSSQTLQFEKDVTDKNEAGDEFVCLLVSSDTDIPVSENYILGVEFDNATTLQNDETSTPFHITKRWVFNDA